MKLLEELFLEFLEGREGKAFLRFIGLDYVIENLKH